MSIVSFQIMEYYRDFLFLPEKHVAFVVRCASIFAREMAMISDFVSYVDGSLMRIISCFLVRDFSESKFLRADMACLGFLKFNFFGWSQVHRFDFLENIADFRFFFNQTF